MARRTIGLAGAFVLMMSAQPATALVCAIAPDDPQNPGVIERTITGEGPMGGDFDVVVLGIVDDIGDTDSDGYRPVTMDVQAVLRGSAPQQYEFSYPAAADEPEPMFVRDATYLVAVESEGFTGGPTASECSATKRIVDPDEITRYIGLAASPVIYGELPATPVSDGGSPTWVLGAVLAAVLVLAIAWLRLQPNRAPRA